MRIIIAPAKKMIVDTDSLKAAGRPCFLDEAKRLLERIRELDFAQAKALWKCSDKLAKLNYERFAAMDPEHGATPAVLSYEGLQYQHLSPRVMTAESLRYIEEHVWILSGFYGALKPFDGVTPYRLEMGAGLEVDGCRNLYAFWGDKIYRAVTAGGDAVVNLASKEYAQAVEAYIKPGDRLITVEFGEIMPGEGGRRVRQKGALAKMARGEMVRFMAENGITQPEGMKAFSQLGFWYKEEMSDESRMVFVR